MEFCYINDDLLNKISTSIFNEDDVRSFVLELVQHLELSDYLNKIDFNYKHTYNMAKYDVYSHDLKIDLESIINDAIYLYDRDDDEEEKLLFINIMIIVSLVHEVVHIKQNSRLGDKLGIYSLMRKEINLLQILTDEEYDDYYIYFSFEREAIATSFEVALYLLKTKIKNDAIFEYMLENLTCILLAGYKQKRKRFISPMQVINSKFSKNSFYMISNKDIYDSLKYGYPVTEEQYRDFKVNSKKTIMRKNNLQV